MRWKDEEAEMYDRIFEYQKIEMCHRREEREERERGPKQRGDQRK
jgi:hypothetical protein